jgi:hypothetical protein
MNFNAYPWMVKLPPEICSLRGRLAQSTACHNPGNQCVLRTPRPSGEGATFVGWDAEERAAYEESGRGIVSLRTELSELESPDFNDIEQQAKTG